MIFQELDQYSMKRTPSSTTTTSGFVDFPCNSREEQLWGTNITTEFKEISLAK